MMHDVLTQAIAAGLQRKSVKLCSQWATKYRMMGKPVPGNWAFDHHPWLREMHDCNAEELVGQKSAQMGYTETALNRTFYAIDIRGESVLYILPTDSDASDFSASRFDPALEMSPHLQAMFSNVKNVGHKRAGSANLFVRGSRSRSKLKSLPVGHIVFDELEEMVQDNIPLALERMSGQDNRSVDYISTPSIAGYGINTRFEYSDQRHYYFKCPHCGKQIELGLENLVVTAETLDDPRIRDSYLQCTYCKGVIPHKQKREIFKTASWVPSYTNRLAHGYYINQLYSTLLPPYSIAETVLKARFDPAAEQELYNSKMGLPHAVKGSQLTDEDIKNAMAHYQKPNKGSPNQYTTIGIDVGKFLHVVIMRFEYNGAKSGDVNTRMSARLMQEMTVNQFEEIDELLYRYNVRSGIIDANPERRKALELCQRFPGLMRMCFYGNGVTGRNLNIHSADQHAVTVDRTSWLDATMLRYKAQRISLPVDTSLEFKEHMKAPVRIYKKDSDGNPVGAYVNSKPDHFAHASNYAEIALAVSANFGNNEDI